jgi:hypothetical protein
MEDIADTHEGNVVRAVNDRLVDFNYDEDVYASGEPRDVDTSPNAPYMRNCEDADDACMSAYVPMWKQLKMVKSDLHNFFTEQELSIERWKAGPKKSPTHVSLNGGSYFMTPEQEEKFVHFYALAVQRGGIFHFTEQATPIMRLFVDLDFLQIKKIRNRDIQAAATVVHASVCKFYEGELNVIASVPGYKAVSAKEDKPDMWKTGVHLHWNVFVDSARALDIRETILEDLEKTFGKRVHPNNDWRDVVDSTVYGSGNGPNTGRLRMMYSHKTDTCPNCKRGKTMKTCETCKGNGRMHTGRPYFPMFVLGSDGKRFFEKEEEYRCNIKQVILDTNIRTSYDEMPEVPAFAMPDGAPKFIPSGGRKRTGFKNTDLGFTAPKDSKLNASTKVSVNNSSQEWEAIEKLLHLQEHYKDVIVTQVTSNEKKNQYVVHVNGPNCRYCANIQREHVSNRIFFVVSPDGISQRCHDNSENATEEMKFGLCSSYCLMIGKITGNFVPILFPNSFAAKIDDSGYQDEDDDDERHFHRPDKKMRRLLEIGDQLSMSLYNIKWSTTLQLSSGEHFVSQSSIAKQTTKAGLAFGDSRYTSDIHTIDPQALGSRHTKALKELGFDNEPEEELVKDTIKVQSMSKLLTRLYKHLSNAVEIAAYLSPIVAMTALERGFDGLVSVRLSKTSRPAKLDYLL